MNDESFYENKAPSGVIIAKKFDILNEDDIDKFSISEFNAVRQVTGSILGLPNISEEWSTCGSKNKKICEGHFEVIKFSFSISIHILC